MATQLDELYERDFYAWTKQQAKALRRLAETRPNAPVDWEHLIEEVADLGKSERDAVRSYLRRIMLHLLKLEHSPAAVPRATWLSTIAEARAHLEDKLTPTLRAHARRGLAALYARARQQALVELEAFGESDAAARLPMSCPFALDELTGGVCLPASSQDRYKNQTIE